MPTLPIKPEPLPKLRARVPAALHRVFVAGHAGSERPGTRRSQVFDFFDGHRLIVSREYFALTKETLLHISVSAEDPVRLMGGKEVSPTSHVWMAHCILPIQKLFDAYWPLSLVQAQVSPAGVVHFLSEDISQTAPLTSQHQNHG